MTTRTRYGGAYLSSSRAKKNTLMFAVGIIIVVMILVAVFSGEIMKGNSKTTYHLPGEVPSFSLPDNLPDYSDSLDLRDLVVPHFNFIIEAGSNSIEVSLPLIRAAFGAEFNTSVLDELDALISNTIFYLEQDMCIVKSMTYEAYLDQEILTILLYTECTDGQSRCQPWIYDLSKGGVLLETCELTDRLLGMRYASFLWVTDRYVQSEFANTFFVQAYAIPEKEMTDEQRTFLDNYRGILREIPRDIVNMYNRWIFPADGSIYLVYSLPSISEDWYAGFCSEIRIVKVDQSILKYTDMITPTEAVYDAMYNTTVHVMGGSDQAHAQLMRVIFCDSPYAFVDAVTGESEQNQEYAISSLLRYTNDAEQLKILRICQNLKKTEYLTNQEIKVIDSISSKISVE